MITSSILVVLLLLSPHLSSADVLSNEVFQEDSAEEIQKSEVKIPKRISKSLGMEVTADSVLVVDNSSGYVLFSKEAQKQVPMASLTKIMTALLAFENDEKMKEEITVDNEMVNVYGGKIKLLRGEKITFSDLVRGALISSGNDAALAIAKNLGNGSVEDFVVMMNEKAHSLGMKSTQFKNPHGLDQDGHYSSAEDMVILFREALKHDQFREVISMKDYQVHALNINKVHYLHNTNKLLHGKYSYMKGGKTGFTDNAGYCLITLSSNSKDDEIITIVLGSDYEEGQFQDSKALIEWAYKTFSWE